MSKFKIGDRVECLSNGYCTGIERGSIGTVRKFNDSNWLGVEFDDVIRGHALDSYLKESKVSQGQYICQDDAKKVDGLDNLTSNFKNMVSQDRFVDSKLKEPQKSFKKAGIVDSRGFLTEDGRAIFLSYLLEKEGVEFKKAVVDPITKEDKE